MTACDSNCRAKVADSRSGMVMLSANHARTDSTTSSGGGDGVDSLSSLLRAIGDGNAGNAAGSASTDLTTPSSSSSERPPRPRPVFRTSTSRYVAPPSAPTTRTMHSM